MWETMLREPPRIGRCASSDRQRKPGSVPWGSQILMQSKLEVKACAVLRNKIKDSKPRIFDEHEDNLKYLRGSGNIRRQFPELFLPSSELMVINPIRELLPRFFSSCR